MREARVPLIGATIGRLPLGAAGLALILLVKAKTGSFAEAGIVEAGLTIGAGVGLPVQGRIIDRTGQTVMLMVSQTVSTVVIVALIVSVHQDAPLGEPVDGGPGVLVPGDPQVQAGGRVVDPEPGGLER